MRPSIAVVLICVCVLFSSCSDSGSSDKVFPFAEGSITLDPGFTWDTVKVGMFFSSSNIADASSNLDTDDEFGSTTFSYRLLYSDLDDGSMAEFAPEDGKNKVKGSGTTGSFWINLPKTPALEADGEYYLIAWIDADADGMIDITDSSTEATQITNSEFSRCPTHTDAPDTYTVYRFYEDGSGGYKFDGYDGTTTFFRALDTDDCKAFAFNIVPEGTGW